MNLNKQKIDETRAKMAIARHNAFKQHIETPTFKALLGVLSLEGEKLNIFSVLIDSAFSSGYDSGSTDATFTLMETLITDVEQKVIDIVREKTDKSKH